MNFSVEAVRYAQTCPYKADLKFQCAENGRYDIPPFDILILIMKYSRIKLHQFPNAIKTKELYHN